MKTLFLKKSFKYDGSQLRTLYAYLEYGVLGDSILSWVGPCDVDLEHMVDGEDRLAGAQICGGRMVHFILELFDRELFSGVVLQRLMASIVMDVLRDLSSEAGLTSGLSREGDDVFVDKGKHSISIATRSVNSLLIHFAVNVSNTGTPVETVSLEDFKVEEKSFAEEVLRRVSREVKSIKEATCKVLPVC